VETRPAFDDAVEERGPDDFFDVKGGFGQAWDVLTLEHLLAWVRLSGWDANVLLDAWPTLMKHAGSAAGIFRVDIYRAVHEVWQRYFPLREARDLAFHLGVLLCEIDCHEDALPFFHESLAAYGPNPATVFNVGLCLYQLGHLEDALRQIDLALADAPEFEPAVELKQDIAAAIRAARPRLPTKKRKKVSGGGPRPSR
jgi:tetratricopeptide (TPR) repeat protein